MPRDLEDLEPVDIEEYLEYLKVYKRDEDGELITNGEKGLARKMSALRSFYGYYFKHQIIQKNPTLLVDMPKLHDKAIIRLDTDEVALLLDFVESAGDHLTGQALNYYKKTRDRDIAILTLLLGTGIRVSNVSDWILRMWILRTMELRLPEKVAIRWLCILAMKLPEHLKII